MFTTNQYFDGKVASLGFNGTEGKATVGVIAPGEYEFGTSTIEIMTVISGQMEVQKAGDKNWTVYKKFESFRRITSYNVCYTKLLRIKKNTSTKAAMLILPSPTREMK